MIDVIIILLILLLSVKGYFNGFVREFVGFFGLIGGVFVASRAAPLLGGAVSDLLHLESMALAKLIAFLAVLAVIWGGSAFVGSTFETLRHPPESTPARIGGMGVAALKYLLIFSLIAASLLGSDLVRDTLGSRLKSSRLAPFLEQTGAILINRAPLPFRRPASTSTPEKTHG